MVQRVPRPAARILLVDGAGRVLLMRFMPGDRPPLWCTPGGAVDPGESYAEAARRELWEEVGLDMDCGPEVAQRTCTFKTFEGVEVIADERYFRVDIDAHEVRPGALTALEQRVLAGSRWFTVDELADWPEIIYPADIADLLGRTEPARA
ncbi:8-oxo-dGTP pyrophosphatase MutT (NUDIX family) [Sphingomonas jinjuensis]|uniref:8-oxo-dGTP pyrophosphatase MutT (NUDIX family) n=1 Tax=Sphingomonas jinjuensis TaxID=535907 RepID=A0A840F8C2_9SPHN|nr:NUDIX domain-containing protein [Sphingomonas jinjuensis]MBB4155483.1 8-oxo-dGTP pyrophosphatase MutT (NUDIX family) [Sphingomonas jinjuensis]